MCEQVGFSVFSVASPGEGGLTWGSGTVLSPRHEVQSR